MSGVGQPTRQSLMTRSRDSHYGLHHHERFLPEEVQVAGRASPQINVQDEQFQNDVEEHPIVSFFKDFRSAAITLRNLKLTGVLVLLIVCGTVENIVYSVNGQRNMAQYLVPLNILVVFGATIFFGAIVAIKHLTAEKTEEDPQGAPWREYKMWFFKNIIAIAFCDTIALYMGILASHNVTAPLRTLLQQGSIPVTMAFSWGFLGRHYRIVHLVGAVAIVMGIFLAILQIITEKGNPGEHSKQTKVQSSDSMWAVVFFLSCFPLSIGSCLKEYVLTHETKRVEMNQVNAWVAACQLIIGLAFSPISYVAANRGQDDVVPSITDFPDNFQLGLQCGMWGDSDACNQQCFYVNGNTHDCHKNTLHCDCGLDLAPVSVWLYVGVCCCFNLIMLYVIKEGTAVLFWISSAAVIPVVSILATSSMYDWLNLGRVKFTIVQICGLVLVVLGIAVYRSQPEEYSDGLEYDDDEQFDDTRASVIYQQQSVLGHPLSSESPEREWDLKQEGALRSSKDSTSTARSFLERLSDSMTG